MKSSWLALLLVLWTIANTGAADAPAARKRRILYNLDGDSCMTLKAGRKGPGPVTTNDLQNLVAEIMPPGSQVDTLLVCINAQVMYYPTRAGTLRGTDSTPEERDRWSAHERQRFANLTTFFEAGIDPYAVLLHEDRELSDPEPGVLALGGEAERLGRGHAGGGQRR